MIPDMARKAKGTVTSRISSNQMLFMRRIVGQTISIWGVFRKDPFALTSILILVMFVLIGIFAPAITAYTPSQTFITSGGAEILEPPSLKHPMGTNHISNDVFTQWVWGTRISIIVGLVSGFSVFVIGTTVGLISGYYKGNTDLIIMRIVDVLYGIPAIPLILVLAMFFGNSLVNILLAFMLVLWRTMARVIRSQTLSLTERPFVKAARAIGASDARIIFLHIAPNVMSIALIQTILIVSWAIALEAAVSFLGLGVTGVSWGTMLQSSFVTGAIRTAWWWVIPPGASITVIVVSLFYISRALEEVINPEVSQHQQ